MKGKNIYIPQCIIKEVEATKQFYGMGSTKGEQAKALEKVAENAKVGREFEKILKGLRLIR